MLIDVSIFALRVSMQSSQLQYDSARVKVELRNKGPVAVATNLDLLTVGVLRRKLAGVELEDSWVFDSHSTTRESFLPLAPSQADSFFISWRHLFRITPKLSFSCIQFVYQPYFVDKKMIFMMQEVYSNRFHVNAYQTVVRYVSECNCRDRKENLRNEER